MSPRKKKAPRPLAETPLDPWRMVVFTDLHVASATLDRALEVLRRVRALAREQSASVVCLGDFWHQRGHLSVRQLDALLDEFRLWQGIETIFIPGNHDQVSVDGSVHGVRVFEAFPNFTVATEPVLWEQGRVAFFPWREEPGAQAALFTTLQGDDWTVFAHAEVKGATTNGAHVAAGRVTLGDIEPKTRACYLGHYHKRQKLGKHTWYIGSPFEMNFGERDMPHGVALIEEGTVAPHFVDFEDFPKHHRLVYGGEWKKADEIAAHDIVEVHAPLDAMGTHLLHDAIEDLPARDVRTLAVEDADPLAAPSIALSLDEAMMRFVEDTGATDLTQYRLRQLGQEILQAVPEAHALQPLSPEVDLVSLTVRDFCGISGERTYTFEDGVTLVRGPMGSGKTSLMDGLTWCLFGQTTPRKAGSHGASLRADEVIHDDATECEVAVTVQLKGRKKPVVIRREKKPGKGSTVKVTGIKAPDGIADAQDLVHAVLGIDQALWRTCVYLGQGAVGNFVTDADKRRKELLSTAFGLDACPAALKVTRDRLRDIERQIGTLEAEMLADERVIAALRETDFTEQIAQWEGQRTGALQAAQADGEAAKAVISQCETHLSNESEWVQSKQQHEVHIDQLTKSLAAANPENRAPELTRQLGAAESERSRLDREDHRVRAELRQHIDGPGACPTCGRPFDSAAKEAHIEALEDQLRNLATQQQSYNARISNIQQQLLESRDHNDAATRSLQTQIESSREALQKCGDALSTMAVLKSNRAEAERRLSAARIAYVNHEKEVNPFLAKQADAQGRVAGLQSKLAADRVQMDAYLEKQGDLGVWDRGFGAKGLAVLVLRGALHELENYANSFMNRLLRGRFYCRLTIEGDNLKIAFFEVHPKTGQIHERRYEQLSGGQRRCVELAFNPFALGEMIFQRCGVRVSTLIVDELTTHLGQDEKPLVCEILRDLDRRSVVVIDHDLTVQSEFDQIYEMEGPGGEIKEAEEQKALTG